MKKIVTCVFKTGELEFPVQFTIGRQSRAIILIRSLLDFKNKNLLEGEELVSLVKIEKETQVSYSHDWKVKGDHYMCMDCKIPGTKENIFSKVVPKFTDPKYKDCSWKLKN